MKLTGKKKHRSKSSLYLVRQFSYIWDQKKNPTTDQIKNKVATMNFKTFVLHTVSPLKEKDIPQMGEKIYYVQWLLDLYILEFYICIYQNIYIIIKLNNKKTGDLSLKNMQSICVDISPGKIYKRTLNTCKDVQHL